MKNKYAALLLLLLTCASSVSAQVPQGWPTSSLLGYWRFNQNGLNTANDFGHCTLQGDASFGTGDDLFCGTSGYASATNGEFDNVMNDGSFTLAAECFGGGNGTGAVVVSKRSASANGCEIRYLWTINAEFQFVRRIQFLMYRPGLLGTTATWSLTSATIFAADSRPRVVVAVNGGQVKMFINGVYEAGVNDAPAYVGNNAPLVFGGSNVGSASDNLENGYIRNGGLWVSALGPCEAQAASANFHISTPPVSQSVDVAQSATFTVAATPPDGVEYFWLANGNSVGSGTSYTANPPLASNPIIARTRRIVDGNECFVEASATLTVTCGSVPGAQTISGEVNPDFNGSEIYLLPSNPAYNYTWTATGGTITAGGSGTGVNTATVQWGSSGTGSITGTWNYGPCSGTSTLPVSIGSQVIDCNGVQGGSALPGTTCSDNDPCTINDVYTAGCDCVGTEQQVSTISGAAQVFGWTTSTFSITPISGATYAWVLPQGWTSTNTTSASLTASVQNTAQTVELCVNVTAAGCALNECKTVTLSPSVGISTVDAGSDAWLSVQPNPSNGAFQLTPSSDGTPMTITVHDATGRTVKAPFVAAGSRVITLDLGDAAPGVYYLLATRDGQHRTLKLMVAR